MSKNESIVDTGKAESISELRRMLTAARRVERKDGVKWGRQPLAVGARLTVEALEPGKVKLTRGLSGHDDEADRPDDHAPVLELELDVADMERAIVDILGAVNETPAMTAAQRAANAEAERVELAERAAKELLGALNFARGAAMAAFVAGGAQSPIVAIAKDAAKAGAVRDAAMDRTIAAIRAAGGKVADKAMAAVESIVLAPAAESAPAESVDAGEAVNA